MYIELQSIFSVSFVNINGLPTFKDKLHKQSKQTESKGTCADGRKNISNIFRKIGEDTTSKQ